MLVPYIVSYARTMFIIGDGKNSDDFVYVENVVNGHICAERTLTTKAGAARSGGKAYFITNMEPMNMWRFPYMVLEELGYKRALGWIWRSNCVPKLKVFTWLLLNDRLNTFDMMDRRHCNRSNVSTCRLCSIGMLEDCNHLFFSCPFSARCWNKIGIQWELAMDLKDRIIHARSSFRGPAFMLIFTCATWHIWKQRNDLVFDREPYSFRRWFICFRQELVYHYPRLKETIRLAISDWLNLIDNVT